jgi:toxin ParE1/3/4
MSRIVRRPSARLDVADIWIYLQDRSERAVDRFLDRLNETLQMLASNPYLGRMRPDLMHELWSFVVDPYVVYFLPLDDGIELVRVLHSSRDVASEFDSED